MRGPAASASLALLSRTGPVMGTLRCTKRYRGWDLNPHGPQGPTDFRTTPIFIGGCVAWTFSSPYPAGRRCCPSSLCTFPGSGLAQDYQVKGFPDVEQFYAGRFRPGTHSISPLRLPIPPPRQIGDSCISTRRDVVRSPHHSSPVEHRPNTCAPRFVASPSEAHEWMTGRTNAATKESGAIEGPVPYDAVTSRLPHRRLRSI